MNSTGVHKALVVLGLAEIEFHMHDSVYCISKPNCTLLGFFQPSTVAFN